MVADRVAMDGQAVTSAQVAFEERFRTLLDRHRPALARLAASYTRTTSDRDDLLQDIAMALWRALPTFRGECSERTFLFRIAHNRCLGHLSRRGTATTVDPESLEVEDPSPSAEARLSREQQSERLLQGIRTPAAHLPPGDHADARGPALQGHRADPRDWGKQRRRAPQSRPPDAEGRTREPTMNMNEELDSWRVLWQAEPEAPSANDLGDRVSPRDAG